ncbi:MAG: hypothetical protein ACOC95_02980, partial [Planctomycetota bacterium]
DVARAVVIVVAAFATGWLLGRVALVGRTAASVALLIGLLAVAGGPAAVYLAWAFLAPGETPPVTIWRLVPTTFAWSAVAPDRHGWLPAPLWPPVVWPAVAAAFWWLGRRAGHERPG